MSQPCVYLIGGGPGDAGLITVRGAELLARADIVLYDGLVNPELLVHATLACECICVGKRGHGGSWKQDQINDTIVRYVREGKRVARLKGGDTSIFARTAEEIDRLIHEGILFEVVPGITTALATSSYTGIPITHRDWASAAALITAQLQPSDGSSEAEEAIDWQALALFPGTLILYMGLSTVGHWSLKLIEYGKRSTTPVALVRRCSWPDQQILRCDLASVSETLRNNPSFTQPSIAIVGEVVQMAASHNWFMQRPLFGQTILLPSPIESTQVLAPLFAEQGAMVLQQPAIRIEPINDPSTVHQSLAAIDRYDWILFSSLHGVNFFFHALKEAGLDARALHRAKIGAVGTGTSEAIAKWGLRCDLVPEFSGAIGLADALGAKVAGQQVLLVRNPDGKTLLNERLTAAGAVCTQLDIYRQAGVESWPLSICQPAEQNRIQWVIATSGNIATHTARLLGSSARNQHWLCLAPAIADTLQLLGCKHVFVAEAPSFESLVRFACQHNGSNVTERGTTK